MQVNLKRVDRIKFIYLPKVKLLNNYKSFVAIIHIQKCFKYSDWDMIL